MLAIMERWEEASGCHTDNAVSYLQNVLLKSGLDSVVFYLCCRKQRSSFISVCGLSIALVDWVLMVFMATVWFFGAERFSVSPCFLLANASATYGALPLPMMCLGLLDHCLDDTRILNRTAFCRCLRNVVLMLLVWLQAALHSSGSVSAQLRELDYEPGVKFLVCEVEQSMLITYFTVGLFTALLFAVLPFWSRIPQWVKEADRLSEATERRGNEKSDLFTLNPSTEAKRCEENYQEKTNEPRPPLWFSLTLAFGIFWIPYLTVSAACLLSGLGVPAYISVNLLWLECTNSVLVGVVFWAKSRTLGPYSHLPENMCLWRVYWHLSRGTRQQQLPVGVFNPSKGKGNTLQSV